MTIVLLCEVILRLSFILFEIIGFLIIKKKKLKKLYIFLKLKILILLYCFLFYFHNFEYILYIYFEICKNILNFSV